MATDGEDDGDDGDDGDGVDGNADMKLRSCYIKLYL